MNIIYICRHFTLGNGHGRLAWELARRAAGEGLGVELVGRRFQQQQELRRRKIFQLPKLFGRWRSQSFAWLASRYARKAAGQYFLTARRKTLIHGFGDAVDQDLLTLGNVDWSYAKYIPSRRLSPSALWIKKKALSNPSAPFIAAVSKKVASELLEFAPHYPRHKVKVLYPGVDLERFDPGRKEELRRFWAKATGADLNAHWIIFAAGGDFEKRNFSTLLAAVARLPLNKPWHFFIAGAAQQSKVLDPSWSLPRTWIRGGGDGSGSLSPIRHLFLPQIAQRMSFLGPQEDLSGLLSAGDLFVYPAWIDEFALVVLEAMAGALPVVSSYDVGAGEILPRQSASRQLVHAADRAGLTAAIDWFLDYPDEGRQIGLANRAAAQNFSWPLVYQRYRRYYQEIFESQHLN